MFSFLENFGNTEKNDIFDFMSPNRAENRPFSFDSRVAFIEYRKVVRKPTFCITLPCPKSTITGKLDKSNYLVVSKSRVFSDGEFDGR